MKAVYRSPKYANNMKWLVGKNLTVTIEKSHQEHVQLE
jgi:hypothetical protein